MEIIAPPSVFCTLDPIKGGLSIPAKAMKPTRLLTTSIAAPVTMMVSIACLTISAPGQGEGDGRLGIDRNGNHASDIYEALYPAFGDGGADADGDGDGMTNEQEAAAGTHPSRGIDVLRIHSIANTGSVVTASWASVLGKVYQLQTAGALAGAWINAGAAVAGTGTNLSVGIPPAGSRLFLRVQVSDTDSDADGVTDWEELQAGTNRYLFDSDGDGRSDRGFVESQLNATGVVDVHPVTTWANETGPRTAQFRVTRHGGFLPLNVSFSTGGTAVRGTDYTLSAASVPIPAGATEGFVTITPLADAEMEAAESVILTLQPGNYQIGPGSSATISIVGQGLNGEYYNTSGSPYENPLNFDPAALAFTRRDPAVDFNWSKPAGMPPGTGTGTPDPQIADDDLWSVRWTGFLTPKTNEVHQIHAIADRGVVVWVSPTPITAAPGTTTGSRINVWTATSPEQKYTANLLSGGPVSVAGQPLYFRVDYRDSAGFTDNANIQIRWSTPTMPEEPIPMSAFSTEASPAPAPVITSPLATGGISGAPFSFQITASNSPTGFSVSGLPSGLTVSASGLISGTLNAPEGYYPMMVTASNASGSDSKLLVLYVTTTGGSATREVWTAIPGTGLAAIPLHTAPATSGTVTTLESPDNAGDQYGERLRGYITAPTTGLYTLFLTTDENAELWVSAGKEPARRLKRAWVSAGAIADGVWDVQPAQKSVVS
jgi:Putative Ig domain/PA14 domain/Bacterial TSP3 repeat